MGYVETLRWIERWAFSDAVRTVPYLYPILESAHILGIALLVGAAIAVDLRLLGVGRNILPVTTVMRYLLPMSHAGFAIVATTGLMMFTAGAWKVGTSPAAPWKLGLIIVAGVNILIFHAGVYRTVSSWDVNARAPALAQAAAVISVASWMSVVVAGRFLAY